MQAETLERKRKAVQPPVPAPAANAKRKKGGKFNKATSQLINKWQSVRQDLVRLVLEASCAAACRRQPNPMNAPQGNRV